MPREYTAPAAQPAHHPATPPTVTPILQTLPARLADRRRGDIDIGNQPKKCFDHESLQLVAVTLLLPS